MFSILVVVPTFNSYLLLPSLVRSLEEQTFKNWRVVFIDGNSSIAHKEWLREQCCKDNRFTWEDETCSDRGIFAAMNQGFKHALDDDWLIFWGSDDMAASKNSFKQVEERILRMKQKPDLYICTARYYSIKSLSEDGSKLKQNRFSRFVHRKTFRNSLFWGSTPPHQATLFGPDSRQIVQQYDESFRLSGDLDYFLRLSQVKDVSIFVDDTVLVLMGDAGVSRRQGQQRFREVIRSYRQSFKTLWMFPFIMRYVQRSWSILFK